VAVSGRGRNAPAHLHSVHNPTVLQTVAEAPGHRRGLRFYGPAGVDGVVVRDGAVVVEWFGAGRQDVVELAIGIVVGGLISWLITHGDMYYGSKCGRCGHVLTSTEAP